MKGSEVMGIATFLVGKAVEKTASNLGKVAAAAAVTATAATVAKAVDMKREMSASEAQLAALRAQTDLQRAQLEAQRQAMYEARGIQQNNQQMRNNVSGKRMNGNQDSKNGVSYEVLLFYAKIAMCSYIINADHKVSGKEEDMIENMIYMARADYGNKVYDKAYMIYEMCDNNFMEVQEHLDRVEVRDIKRYLQSAEDIAQIDGCGEAEIRAINRINAYIKQRMKDEAETSAYDNCEAERAPIERKSFTPMDLTCPGCAAKMRMDSYGYMAECDYCGLEKLINPDNAPINFSNVAPIEQKFESVAPIEEPLNIEVVPTMPIMPKKPVYPKKANPKTLSEYQMKMAIYQREMEQYKKDFVAYQKYVISHPNG